MDEVKIVSKFTNGIISKMINMVLRRKLGYEINIRLNQITVTIIEGKIHVHLDADAELEKEELMTILKEEIGLR